MEKACQSDGSPTADRVLQYIGLCMLFGTIFGAMYFMSPGNILEKSIARINRHLDEGIFRNSFGADPYGENRAATQTKIEAALAAKKAEVQEAEKHFRKIGGNLDQLKKVRFEAKTMISLAKTFGYQADDLEEEPFYDFQSPTAVLKPTRPASAFFIVNSKKALQIIYFC